MNALPSLPPLPDPAMPAPLPAVSASGFSRRQKAAILVRHILAEGASLSLSSLPENLQAALVHELASLRLVDQATVDAVVNEFLEEIEAVGLSFPRGVDGALKVLDGTISHATASRLRRQSTTGFDGDPWEGVTGGDPDQLLRVLETESVEVAAVLLSKLKVAQAAELLGRLPGERARRITYAVSLTGAVAPETVHRVGVSLARQLDTRPPRAFSDGPVDRVGAILNSATTATREDVLTGLEQTDADFAEQVRRAIFTFANIPARIDARDIPKILREVEQSDLITAIAGTRNDEETASADFILANMSQRMADNLRDEAGELGTVGEKEADAAMNAIVTAIRALEAAGEVFLVAGDED